jgi:CPA1 family monovalent cation:H+ antiporter
VGVLGSYEALLPAGPLRDFITQLADAELSSDVLLQIFLPLLLFEVALNLDGRALLDDLWPVLTLAVGRRAGHHRRRRRRGLGGLDLPLAACLLIASVIATTDPAAVVQIFREVGAPRRLMTLVEGESLLNDAAAIALFTSLLGIVGSRTRSTWSTRRWPSCGSSRAARCSGSSSAASRRWSSGGSTRAGRRR